MSQKKPPNTYTLDHWLFGPGGIKNYLDRLKKNGVNIHQINQLTQMLSKFDDFDILHSMSNWSLGYLHGAAGRIIDWAKEAEKNTDDQFIKMLLRILINQAESIQLKIIMVLDFREISLEDAKKSDPFPVGPGPIIEQMEPGFG